MSTLTLKPLQIRPLIQISRHKPTPIIKLSPPKLTLKSHQTHHSQPTNTPNQTDDGIPIEEVKFLAKFKSRHNYIRVLQISRKADHPLAGSRLLLLDAPGNIHSISFHFKPFTDAYYDVFATFPPIIPPGPVAILGFGAGSAARLILELYPHVVVHAWELDPAVIDVAREYFGLAKLEKKYEERFFLYIGNALNASIRDGFSGILVDLFSRGSLIPELQDSRTWVKLRKCLRKGGRVMVNVGGRCVEAEDKRRDGKVVMDHTLEAMCKVFGEGRLFVSNIGNRRDESSVALTGELPDLDLWKEGLTPKLRRYVDTWKPFQT